jgi:putative FmdB family regulatory protein
MPLYPFACSDCGAEFEALVTRPTADPKAECPSCGGLHVTRGFGVPARPAAEPQTNCRGDGPPCGAPLCGRTRNARP